MVACATSSSAWLSSSTAKRAGTFASNGTRCRSRSQKAWMVSILSPPGVSTARANRRRARRSRSAPGRTPSSSRSSSREASSSSVTHWPRRSKTRIAMFGGRRLGEGQAEDLPGRRAGKQEPQHAVGQHLRLARAGIRRDPGRGARIGGARCCASAYSRGTREIGCQCARDAHDCAPPRPARSQATIPSRVRDGRIRRSGARISEMAAT